MMQKVRNILILGVVVLAMMSCVTSRKVNYMQEPGKHKIPAYADTVDYTEYKVRPNDRLYIYVYSLDPNIMSMYNAGGGTQSRSQMQQQMMGGGTGRSTNELYTYLVDEDGDIDFPTIGKVHVAGLTTRETKRKMEEELGSLLKEIPGYSTISVEVNIMQRTYSLIGVKSGLYTIDKEKLTIFEALAQMPWILTTTSAFTPHLQNAS